ncbi:hypothetical protein ZIOFF_009846 [Zingiber officinale]|uniref:Formyl transferase C-terminal domain-containing protein n=1 Tax=Zingiber officinale TaxID=94328 RepID=A0A8J5LP04_ZINOF|nr:hypothetical protein ZIOFF_009846 [Zingiber officinale]
MDRHPPLGVCLSNPRVPGARLFVTTLGVAKLPATPLGSPRWRPVVPLPTAVPMLCQVECPSSDGLLELGRWLSHTEHTPKTSGLQAWAYHTGFKLEDLGCDWDLKPGSGLLLRELPHILDGIAKLKAQPQDHSKASLAPKLTNDESCLSFDQDAKTIHNKVRAFADWPGTRAKFQVIDMNGNANVVEIKITTTRISDATDVDGGGNEIIYSRSALLVPCAGDSWLEVLELQPPGKKVMSARDFWNGLRGQRLKLPQKALSHI